MALTKVQIISNALLQLGHDPIQTLDNDNADSLVIAAESAYDFLLPSFLSKNNWRFATRISELSKINNQEPPAAWRNIYMLPAGYLKNIRIYPQTYDYEIYEDTKLYTNHSGKLYMEHIFQPDPSRFPAWFVEAFVYKIASYLALSNAQKTEYYPVIKQEYEQQMSIAMAIDAQNRPNFSQSDIPMLNITRFGNYQVSDD